MKQRLRFSALAAALLLVAPWLTSQALAADCTVYGEGVDLAETTSTATLLADPDAWAGKTVRVEGEVREVCPKAGCWLSLVPTTDGDAAPLRVKVEDGVIVFPLSARGQRAAAQGTVEVQDMSRERYTAWLEHLAEERGETFDSDQVGEGPFRHIQVKAAGAEVCATAD